jgi:predicted nucleic acid-binding protein
VRRAPVNADSSSPQGSLPGRSPRFPASTTSGSEPISTLSSIKTPRLATWSNSGDGLIDTSVAVDPGAITSLDCSIEIAISTLTLAELVAGLYAASDELMRVRRQNHLRRVESEVAALPFDVGCAHAWSQIHGAVECTGRKPRGARVVDLMIAATALAHELPLYTLNPRDLRGLEDLIEIIDVGA